MLDRLAGLPAWLVRRALARPPGFVAVLLALMVFIGLGMARFQASNDMLALAPESSEYDSLAEALERFDLASELLFHVRLDEAQEDDRARLIEGAEALCAELEADPEYERVACRLESGSQERLASQLFAHRFSLVDPTRVADRVSPEGIRQRLLIARQRLLSPQAVALEDFVARDPLGLTEVLLEEVLAGNSQFAVQLSEGWLLSEDGRHLLLLARPVGNAFDVEASAARMDRTVALLERLGVEQQGLGFDVIGGPVYASTAYRLMRGDMMRGLSFSSIGILLLTFFLFRSRSAVPLVVLPSMLGLSVPMALSGYLGSTIHTLAIGFGAVLLGISVDYALHVFVRLELTPQKDHAGLAAVVRELTPPLFAGALSTALAIGLLQLASAPALRQISWLGTAGILASFVLTVVALPPLVWWFGLRKAGATPQPRWLPRALRRAASATGAAALKRGRWLGPVAIVSCVVAALLGRQVPFDGDVRSLNHVPDHIRQTEQRFAAAFRAVGSSASLVVAGQDLESLLQSTEDAEAVLLPAVERGELAGVTRVSGLVPSRRSQQERLDWWRREGPRVEAEIARVAAELGFAADYFAPFGAELAETLADPGWVGPEVYQDTPLAPALQRRLAVADDGRAWSMLMIDAGPDEEGALGFGGSGEAGGTGFPPAVRQALSQRAPAAQVLSFPDMAARAVGELQGDLGLLSTTCVALILALLGAYYRRAGLVLLAFVPCGFAFTWGLGGMWLLGLKLDLMNVSALVMALGIALDYGIFLTDGMAREGGVEKVMDGTGVAVMASFATTIVGVGGMMLAETPAVARTGLVFALTISAGAVGAIAGVPALWPLLGSRLAPSETPAGSAEPASPRGRLPPEASPPRQ